MRYIVPLAIILTLILVMAFYDTVAELVWFIGYIVVFSLAGGALITLAFGALTAHERWRKMGLERKRQKYEIIKDGFGMVHLLNLETDIIENLSAYPGTHHNGRWEDPHPAAAAAWFALVGKTRSESPVNLLPAGQMTIEQKLDLLELIDQYPHCHIYGASGGGKTGLLRTIAYRRQMQGHQVLVLDSTEHPAKWRNLTRIRDRVRQNEAIAKLFAIYKQNEAALSSGQAIENDFIQITVLSDEWTDIALDNDLAKQFIREQVRKVRKFGIHLVFATQTDLASDLGLDGAYKTTNSFLKLELKKLPDGQYVAVAKIGYQALGEFPVPAPPPLPEMPSTGYVAPSLETAKPIEIEPTEEELLVLSMLASGASHRQISREVWGGIGSFYNQKINAIAQKYGVRREEG